MSDMFWIFKTYINLCPTILVYVQATSYRYYLFDYFIIILISTININQLPFFPLSDTLYTRNILSFS